MSGTMLCAQKAGIKVFATGGIGGVHREGENSKYVVIHIYALATHTQAHMQMHM